AARKNNRTKTIRQPTNKRTKKQPLFVTITVSTPPPLKVFTTKQPTDYYRNDKRVRDYLDNGIAPNMYSIALLAAADRTYQITSEIFPKISESNIICDRY
ncbi:hypothetical protein, partial [Salmonella enterica]|uniref:hypothetical protein n=1 Tax=Salmonella enterica TaxID=28901 RepID=UPI0020C3D55F